ncbi:MAG: CBS domain-containing protein [Pseudomonadales bacterium]|nr:CBS domain-containing protein [Pseudomonadales bacterium]
MNKIIKVREVMQDHFIMIDGLATVREAINDLIRDEGTTLVVKKRSEHDEFGIVVLADIAKKVLAVDRSPDRVNVYEIMSKPVICIDGEMDVRYCSRLFDRFGLSLAPVVKDGEVVGVVDYKGLVLHGMVRLMDQSTD